MPAPVASSPRIEELRARYRSEPKSRHFLPLGEELRKAGQLADAEKVLRDGLGNHPAYLSGWISLGRVLKEQSRFQEALEALQRALTFDAGNVVTARLLAETFLALGQKVEAIKKFKLVHALLPQDEEIIDQIAALERDLSSETDGPTPAPLPASAVPSPPPAAAAMPVPAVKTPVRGGVPQWGAEDDTFGTPSFAPIADQRHEDAPIAADTPRAAEQIGEGTPRVDAGPLPPDDDSPAPHAESRPFEEAAPEQGVEAPESVETSYEEESVPESQLETVPPPASWEPALPSESEEVPAMSTEGASPWPEEAGTPFDQETALPDVAVVSPASTAPVDEYDSEDTIPARPRTKAEPEPDPDMDPFSSSGSFPLADTGVQDSMNVLNGAPSAEDPFSSDEAAPTDTASAGSDGPAVPATVAKQRLQSWLTKVKREGNGV